MAHLDTKEPTGDFSGGLGWFATLEFKEPRPPRRQVIFHGMQPGDGGEVSIGMDRGGQLRVWLVDGRGTPFESEPIVSREGPFLLVVELETRPKRAMLRCFVNNNRVLDRRLRGFRAWSSQGFVWRIGNSLNGDAPAAFTLAELGLNGSPLGEERARLWNYSRERYGLSA